MKRFLGGILFLNFAVLLLIPSGLVAEEGKTIEKEEINLPKTGILSSLGSFRAASFGAAMPIGDLDLNENKPSPISGSISKQGSEALTVSVSNNRDDRGFALSLQLIQYNEAGVQIKTDSFASSLSPMKSFSRSVSQAAGMTSAELKLLSWKEQ